MLHLIPTFVVLDSSHAGLTRASIEKAFYLSKRWIAWSSTAMTQVSKHQRRLGIVLVPSLFESRLLVFGDLRLVLGLPLLVRHAVDQLATLVFGHRHPTRIGGVLHPVRQTI